MGVKNLWHLLSVSARTIDIKSLEGAIVAVDISIWMIKILHGMAKTGVSQFGHAHLIGMMKRIIYLLSLGIKPVFVFDGPAPEIKRRTIQQRQQMRAQYNINIKKLAERYLIKLMEKGKAPEIEQENQLDEIDNLIRQVNDEEESQYDSSELEIHQQKRLDICNLEYKLYKQHIPITEKEFKNLSLDEKEELLQSISVSLTHLESNDLNQISKTYLDNQLQRFEYLQEIRNIRIEAARQIELLRIEKILEKENDETAQKLREYVRNNEDLQMKLGQLGVDNIFLYLKDEQARKQLVDKIYGKKMSNKKKKLKDWQIENQNLKAVREKVKKRYQMKQMDQQQLEEVDVEKVEKNNDELFDCYDMDNINDLENILLKEIQFVDNYIEGEQQINSEKNNQSNKAEINKQQNQLSFNEEPNQQVIQQKEEIGLQSERKNRVEDNDENEEEEEEEEEEEDEFEDEIQIQSSFSNKNEGKEMQLLNLDPQIKQSQLQQLNPQKISQDQDDQKSILQNHNRYDYSENCQQQIQSPSQFFKKSTDKQPSQEQIDNVLNNLEIEDVDEDEMVQVLMRYQNDFGSLQNKFEEVRYLLQLFGIPYIIAPGESEAQCAFLQQNKLVDCVITEDSDVFLFGGTKVLKGLFEKDSKLNYYGIEQIAEELGLTREKLIYLALFLGSDYTEGIKGVGIVNAMEIVECFDTVEALKRFSAWANKADILLTNIEEHYENIPEKERKFKEMHKNYKKYWELPSNFPSSEVIDAYMVPNVDKSLEPFSWGTPAISKIEEFCLNVLEWNQERTNGYVIEPLNRTLNQNQQQKITAFFRPKLENKVAVINSRRIQDVVKNLTKVDHSREQISTASKRQNVDRIYKQKKTKEKKNIIPQCHMEGNNDLDEFQYQKKKK